MLRDDREDQRCRLRFRLQNNVTLFCDMIIIVFGMVYHVNRNAGFMRREEIEISYHFSPSKESLFKYA